MQSIQTSFTTFVLNIRTCEAIWTDQTYTLRRGNSYFILENCTITANSPTMGITTEMKEFDLQSEFFPSRIEFAHLGPDSIL